jgi:Flp pilus assembly protein TadD
MPTLQEQYDAAMLVFSRGEYDQAIAALEAVLTQDPEYFDARLALGMAFCRKGDFAAAIEHGGRAERLRPDDPLVHTNLSVFHMKAGDKATAEAYGLKARVAAWKQGGGAPSPAGDAGEALGTAATKPKGYKLRGRLPDMPWKRHDS